MDAYSREGATWAEHPDNAFMQQYGVEPPEEWFAERQVLVDHLFRLGMINRSCVPLPKRFMFLLFIVIVGESIPASKDFQPALFDDFVQDAVFASFFASFS